MILKKKQVANKKGKKTRSGKKHVSIKVNKFYAVKGDAVERKGKFCPRCGTGNWLYQHSNRAYCGRCGYTELERSQDAKT